ncbi:MAG: hypothetical protein CH6_0061 [Candidatus Kapaibacterium sp.]|nr:MAG: hypothetical protein CH6_0061 [Candidatus Kapabacteria bacterium]
MEDECNFKLWSELNPIAIEELKPNLGWRSWDALTKEEKHKIWIHLKNYFFVKKDEKDDFGFQVASFEFLGKSWEQNKKLQRVISALTTLNERYKAKSYAKNFLEHPNIDTACRDFYDIFIMQSENVVMELLSLYCKALISERASRDIQKGKDETEEEYQNRLKNWKEFDDFAQRLNDVFEQFGVNVVLTRQGFIPRQDEKITKEIYEPVLKFLSDEKWSPVNRDLKDAFRDYQQKTPDGHSSCITHTISSIEAFLQIILYGKTGKGTLAELILEAQKKNLIPNDTFTSLIFKNIKEIFAQERKHTGDSHPKKEYATEKNARMILNLAMIFFQHCIQI